MSKQDERSGTSIRQIKVKEAQADRLVARIGFAISRMNYWEEGDLRSAAYSFTAAVSHDRGHWPGCQTDYLLEKRESDIALALVRYERCELDALERLLTGEVKANKWNDWYKKQKSRIVKESISNLGDDWRDLDYGAGGEAA